MNEQTFYHACTNKLYAMFVCAAYLVYIELQYSILELWGVCRVSVELIPTLTLSTMWRVLTPSIIVAREGDPSLM
jgi:hypothetical protein